MSWERARRLTLASTVEFLLVCARRHGAHVNRLLTSPRQGGGSLSPGRSRRDVAAHKRPPLAAWALLAVDQRPSGSASGLRPAWLLPSGSRRASRAGNVGGDVIVLRLGGLVISDHNLDQYTYKRAPGYAPWPDVFECPGSPTGPAAVLPLHVSTGRLHENRDRGVQPTEAQKTEFVLWFRSSRDGGSAQARRVV